MHAFLPQKHILADNIFLFSLIIDYYCNIFKFNMEKIICFVQISLFFNNLAKSSDIFGNFHRAISLFSFNLTLQFVICKYDNTSGINY